MTHCAHNAHCFIPNTELYDAEFIKGTLELEIDGKSESLNLNCKQVERLYYLN